MTFTRGIRFRLAALSAAVVAAIGAALGISSYPRLERDLARAAKDHARDEAFQLAEYVAPARTVEEVLATRAAVLKNLLGEPGLEGFEVRTPQGALVWRLPEDPARFEEPLPWELEAARRGEIPAVLVRAPGHEHRSVRALAAAASGGETRWIASAQLSYASGEVILAKHRRSVLLGLALAVPAVFAGSFGLVTLALRPIKALVAGARAIASEGPGRRLKEPPEGSELGELARLLNLMLARMEETFTRLHRFAADASHELRTPLTRMRGEAEVALTRGDEAAAREALASNIEEIDKLMRIVEGLLELARGDAPRREEGTPFDLAALARELASEARVVGESRAVDVAFDGAAGGEASVRANRDLLGRALWNLLDNALKFAPAGGHVRVRVERAGQRALAIVTDDGPGLPPEVQAHLFEPLFRGDAARSHGGHGLGLALSRTIARRYGGDLVATSGPGRGACLTLSVPLAR